MLYIPLRRSFSVTAGISTNGSFRKLFGKIDGQCKWPGFFRINLSLALISWTDDFVLRNFDFASLKVRGLNDGYLMIGMIEGNLLDADLFIYGMFECNLSNK